MQVIASSDLLERSNQMQFENLKFENKRPY